MALQSAQSVTTTAAAAVPITPTASDTIPASSFGVQGVLMRVITTGTIITVTVLDPGFTDMFNAGTALAQAMPATGVRNILIPNAAVAASTGVATVTFSPLTGCTYELYRI
jgi:hypothetical protein